MTDKQQFDFWYAVNNTELIQAPNNRLETFGDTIVNYYLVCELMDSVNKVRVREGRLKALKPAIITPQSLGQLDVEAFGDDAQQYADWLAKNGNELKLLQYGFKIEKTETKEYVITDPLETVTERVKSEVEAKNDPLSAILIGVDDPWQVCLLKLMVDLVQRSASGNIQDIRNRVVIGQQNAQDEIEKAFLAASRNPALINSLADMLKQLGIFEQNEDRFFALVKAANK